MRWKDNILNFDNVKSAALGQLCGLDYIFDMEFLKRLFPLILTAIIQAASTCGKAITCTAGDFPVGANASLVCYFPDDIDNHDSVLVQYYPFSAPTDASYVLHCKAEDVKASKCNEQNGYVLKRHTRNTLLIGIANITEKAAGRYNCQFLPHDKSPMEMCNLTVRGKTAGVTPMEVDVSQDSSTINIQSGETETVNVRTLVEVIVAVIVVAAVVIAVIIIIVVILFRRRHERPAETQGIEIVDRPMRKRTIDTQVSVERLAEKRSIQTQVSVDRGLAALLINTQSSGTKTPATRTSGTTSVLNDSEMNCEMELTKRKAPHKGQPEYLVNSSDSLTDDENLAFILANSTAVPPRNV